MRSPWALVMVGGILRVLAQDFRHDIGRGRRTHHHGAAAVLRIHRALDGAIDDGEEDRRTKALPEMPIHLTGKTRATELIRAGELKGTTTPVGVRASVQST